MSYTEFGRQFELFRYRTAEGRVPYSEWLRSLDRSVVIRLRAHVNRMKSGNFGRSEPVGEGVSELKIDLGPGYRVYYIRDAWTVVVLLCGGDKRSQQTDIREARGFAADYWRRK